MYVRNGDGQMVPLSGVLESGSGAGPNAVPASTASPPSRSPAPGQSTGEAMEAVRELAAKTLPAGYGFEWSGASYQEVKAVNQAPIVLAFGRVVVFLVLAAQYERSSPR